MSMFHELMMRKKEQIMYATIKGTLTENDGVFSGFSASGYLALQQNFAPEGSWEICFKVKMGGNTSLAKYFFGSTSYGIVLGNTDTPSGAFEVFLSSNGTSWDIGNLSTSISNPSNSIRYVKLGFTGTKYYIEQSEDGITYDGRAELNSTKKIYSVPVRIGNSYEASSRYWQGNIDLNRSYIKLGSTKYKLQAVVGYTVVGSPTITDGVVSGFSSSDYLQMPSIDFSKNFELNVELTPNSSASSATTIFGGRNAFYAGWSITAQNQIIFRLRLTDGQTTNSPILFTSNSLTANNTYVANAKRTGNIVEFKVYENGVLFSSGTYTIAEGFNWTTDLQGVFGVGVNNSGVAFDGSIDMNETYIKINGKLWFNGQQA